MKKKILCAALLAGIGLCQNAAAQTYDDRWYLTAGMGVGFMDRDRNTTDEIYGTIGIGKFITPNVSLDLELWHTNPDLAPLIGTDGSERNWELMSLSLVGRYHFLREGRDWHPYVLAGIGAQEHHDGTQRQPLILGYNQSRTGTNMVGLLGLGFQKDLGYAYIRGETGVRLDFDRDDDAFIGADGDDYFTDAYLGFQFVFPIGPEAAPAPEPVVVVQKTCADLDDDGDGVNNCDDRCPATPAGEAIGADGCPVPAPEPVLEPKPYRG